MKIALLKVDRASDFYALEDKVNKWLADFEPKEARGYKVVKIELYYDPQGTPNIMIQYVEPVTVH